MSTAIELALTFLSIIGIGQLCAHRGERMAFLVGSVAIWCLVNASIIAAGAAAASGGWFTR